MRLFPFSLILVCSDREEVNFMIFFSENENFLFSHMHFVSAQFDIKVTTNSFSKFVMQIGLQLHADKWLFVDYIYEHVIGDSYWGLNFRRKNLHLSFLITLVKNDRWRLQV